MRSGVTETGDCHLIRRLIALLRVNSRFPLGSQYTYIVITNGDLRMPY